MGILTAIEFYNEHVERERPDTEGRAFLRPEELWLTRVKGCLILCTDRRRYPVIRRVTDDEPIEMLWPGLYRPAYGERDESD